jgi:hypothetical protein
VILNALKLLGTNLRFLSGIIICQPQPAISDIFTRKPFSSGIHAGLVHATNPESKKTENIVRTLVWKKVMILGLRTKVHNYWNLGLFISWRTFFASTPCDTGATILNAYFRLVKNALNLFLKLTGLFILSLTIFWLLVSATEHYDQSQTEGLWNLLLQSSTKKWIYTGVYTLPGIFAMWALYRRSSKPNID